MRLHPLADLSIAVLADRAGSRLSMLRNVTAREGCVGSHTHPPVGHHEFVPATVAALMIELREQDAVPHELPAAAHISSACAPAAPLVHRRMPAQRSLGAAGKTGSRDTRNDNASGVARRTRRLKTPSRHKRACTRETPPRETREFERV